MGLNRQCGIAKKMVEDMVKALSWPIL